jgi:butyryl-CoA dehydrogenase
MDFGFSEEQLELYGAVQEFCDDVLAPKAEETDARGEFPWDNVKQMAQMDLFGIPVPEEYGGMGLSWVDWAVVGEQLAHACTTSGAVFAAHMLCMYPILSFGSDEQKEKYLTPLATGEKVGAMGLTEPDVGSDAGSVKTKAKLVGDEYLLNGTKIFITNGGAADCYVVIANANPEKGMRGLTAFIMEKGMEGFEIGKNEKKMGFASVPNTELIFQDARVPKENVLGREGRGFRVAMDLLDVGRIGMAIGAVGLSQKAYDDGVAYSLVREQFGRKISEFQAIQHQIADMAMEIEAGRLLSRKAAWCKDNDHAETSKIAAMAKVYTSEVCARVCNRAVNMHGGHGYICDHAVQRYLRESKLFELVEGTSEIQRNVIALEVLKEAIAKRK